MKSRVPRLDLGALLGRDFAGVFNEDAASVAPIRRKRIERKNVTILDNAVYHQRTASRIMRILGIHHRDRKQKRIGM
jgi:hypothetical protein